MGGGGRPGASTGRAGRRRERASDLPVLGRRLIELELRDSVGSGEIEGRGLVEVKLGLGRAARGGDPGRPMRQIEMAEDALNGGGERDEGDDAHLTAADGAEEREHLATNASRRCPRARSCAHSKRLDREHGVGPVGPVSSERSGGTPGWDA